MTDAVKPEVPEEEVDAQAPVSVQVAGLWKPVAIAVLISGLVSSASLGGYHLIFKDRGALATVDLSEVVKIREIQFSSLVNRPNVTDKERVDAWNLVNRIGPEIEQALEKLQQDCNCTLVVKSAVLAGPHEDMTEALKAHIGIAGLSSKAMMESAARSMPPAIPSQATQPNYGGAGFAGGTN